MISREVHIHHVSPIHILSIIRKVCSQSGFLVGSMVRHTGEIFIFVKNDIVLSWQMNN